MIPASLGCVRDDKSKFIYIYIIVYTCLYRVRLFEYVNGVIFDEK